MIKKICIVAFLIISMLILSILQVKPKPLMLIHKKVTLLSYIPPLDMTGQVEPLFNISLEKIDFFKSEEDLDELARLERFIPLIDKVIYVPRKYASYQHDNLMG